ncbi:MAG: PD40 domain-containing protein [Anaerolineales bacterium]|nr:PD40 domain-containing protein [Anaerolineales bacterium]
MYQTGLIKQKQIGFVNADGTNAIVLEVGEYLRKPVWSSEGNLIYGMAEGLLPNYRDGSPAYWYQNRGLKKCRVWDLFWSVEGSGNQANPMDVLIYDYKKILLANLENCMEIKVLVDYMERSELGVLGAAYLWDEEILLYGLEENKSLGKRNYRVIKIDLKTNQAVDLANGINPSWSPDGAQVAYLQGDGIYIINADGTQARRLVRHTFVDLSLRWFGVLSPLPRWSPDGKWLVYHRCEKDSCMINDNTIYKVDVLTGTEVKIIDGGAFPDWRR